MTDTVDSIDSHSSILFWVFHYSFQPLLVISKACDMYVVVYCLLEKTYYEQKGTEKGQEF